MFTELEFLEAMKQYPEFIETPTEYRFYYDDTGRITVCSQNNHQTGGNYIVVTEYEYRHYYQYCIENGKLKKIDIDIGYRVQLKSSTQGYRVVKNHAGIVLATDETYEHVEYYDHS